MIHQAQEVLKALGLPGAQQNDMSALTLLALLGLGPQDAWTSAARSRRTVSKDIMAFAAERYGKAYAPNTRETFRRQVLHQFVQARIADYNPFEPDLPTNSPRAHYAISEDALAVILTFGTKGWAEAVARFTAAHGSLANTYAKHRSSGKLVPLTLPDREPAITNAAPSMSHTDARVALHDVVGARLVGTPDIAACIDAIDASTHDRADPSRDERAWVRS